MHNSKYQCHMAACCTYHRPTGDSDATYAFQICLNMFTVVDTQLSRRDWREGSEGWSARSVGVILLFLPHGGREERGVCVCVWGIYHLQQILTRVRCSSMVNI